MYCSHNASTGNSLKDASADQKSPIVRDSEGRDSSPLLVSSHHLPAISGENNKPGWSESVLKEAYLTVTLKLYHKLLTQNQTKNLTNEI